MLRLRVNTHLTIPSFTRIATLSTSAASIPIERKMKKDLVAIVGTTGVGKSQLSIELARSLSKWGQVINSDSMQVYRGLDVITNKVTEEEKKGVEHHLMGFLDPGKEYQVGDFQRDALQKIEELHENDTVPIVVGGTTYYLQHLLFPNQLVSDVPSSRPSSPTATPTLSSISHFPSSLKSSILSLPQPLLDLFLTLPLLPLTSSPKYFPPQFPLQLLPPPYQSPEEFTIAVYSILKHVDPQSAERWHWRDLRKVRRALDIVWEGRRWRDVLDEQKVKMEEEGEDVRYRTIIFWLYAEPDVLNERLDKRVDKMLELGLLEEITELWKLTKSENPTDVINYSKGIYQAIGYKEFVPYLQSLSPNTTTLDPSHPLFLKGLEEMELSTRQYAKKQIKWIKAKLLPEVRKRRDVVLVLLDATDLGLWEERVKVPAVDLLKSFLAHEELPDPTTLSALAATQLASPPTELPTSRQKITCEICTKDPTRPFLVEERQWELHVKSKGHKFEAVRAGGGSEAWKERERRKELRTKMGAGL